MIIAVWLSLALLIVILASFLFGTKKDPESLRTGRKSREPSQQSRIPGIADRPCPLCRTMLKKGETVHSVLYPGKPDSMMYIYGCPFCYQEHPRKKGNEKPPEGPRQCPACKEVLGEEDYVIARVFEKPEKTHVHVLGCTICR